MLAVSEAVCDAQHPQWLAPHFLPLLEWLETEAGVTGLRECQWSVDPANFALVGAGAMLAGTVRLRLFTIVLMVELTSDPLFILPCAIGVMVAVWIGDKCNHGIYHRLIDLASFPLLTDAPTLEQAGDSPSSPRLPPLLLTLVPPLLTAPRLHPHRCTRASSSCSEGSSSVWCGCTATALSRRPSTR